MATPNPAQGGVIMHYEMRNGVPVPIYAKVTPITKEREWVEMPCVLYYEMSDQGTLLPVYGTHEQLIAHRSKLVPEWKSRLDAERHRRKQAKRDKAKAYQDAVNRQTFITRRLPRYEHDYDPEEIDLELE